MFSLNFLRYFATLQISLSLFVSGKSLGDTVSVSEDQVCVPLEIAELAKNLGKFDSPEVSIFNTSFPFSYSGMSAELDPSREKEVEIEDRPFGSLPVDWKRLRLLHDCLTSSDAELKAKLLTAYKILILANDRLHAKFSPTESFADKKISLNIFFTTEKSKRDFDTAAETILQISKTNEAKRESIDSTSGVENDGAVRGEKYAEIVSFTTTDGDQLVHRQHRSTYNEENGYPDSPLSTVEPKLSREVEGARETALSGEITTPGGSSSSLTNRGHKKEEDSHPTTFYGQRNSFAERRYSVNSTNNNNHRNDYDDDDDDDNDNDNDNDDNAGVNGNSVDILGHENSTIIVGELIQSAPSNDPENTSTVPSRVETGEYRESEEAGSGAETKEVSVDRLKKVDADLDEEKISRRTEDSLDKGEDSKTVPNSRSESQSREQDQEFFSYRGTATESRTLDSRAKEKGVKKSSDEESGETIFESSSDGIFEGSASGNGQQSYDYVTSKTIRDSHPMKLASEEIKPDETKERTETTVSSIKSVSDESQLRFTEESGFSKRTNAGVKVSLSIPETKNNFEGTETSVLREEAVESSTSFHTFSEEGGTVWYQENSTEEFAASSSSRKNTAGTGDRTTETSVNTAENNRWYFATVITVTEQSGKKIDPEVGDTKDLIGDPFSKVPRPTELVVLIGDREPEAGGIQEPHGALEHRTADAHFRSDSIDLAPVQNSPPYRHYEMDNSVDDSLEFRRGKSSPENYPTGTRKDPRGQEAPATSEKLTPPVFAPFHPLLAGGKPARKHKLTAATRGNAFSKREGRNTDLEKLFRWFYGLGENADGEKTGRSGDDGVGSIAKAEISCKTQ